MPLPENRGSPWPALLATALWLLASAASLVAGPQSGPEPPADLAAREAQLEELWATVLALGPDVDPVHKLEAWGVVFISELMVDRMRAAARGVEDPGRLGSESSRDRVLARWRRERPEEGGPDLFVALEEQDPDKQRRAVVELLDRYPDDPLVVWQATTRLRQAGDVRREVELLEAFLIRNPDRPVAYRLAADHYGWASNDSELARVLRGWADLAPGDPELVARWLRSPLASEAPEETAALLDRFFATAPAGTGAVEACLKAARVMPAFTARARACLERLAALPDDGWGGPQRATRALAQLAAVGDDRPGLESALGQLDPEARFRARIEAVGRLEAPARCGERIDQLRAAMAEMIWDGDQPGSVAHALRPCAGRQEAEALFLELVRRTPAARLDRVIGGWATHVNGVWRGRLPADSVAPILEARLESEGVAEKLFWSLDVVYQLAGEVDKRLALLWQWQEALPATLRAEQAIALARGLVLTDSPDEARRVLERQLEHRFEHEVVVELWGHDLAFGDPAGAERFARDLIASGQRGKVSIGHLLAARSAVLRQEYGEAERQYWAYLAGEFPRREAATELLALVAFQERPERLPALARRICEETRIGRGRGGPESCAAELLAESGSAEAAAELLAERAAELPDDLPALRELARSAEAAGRPELAEQALRRVLELDPAGRDDWLSLAAFLEREARHEELEELLRGARTAFDPVPSLLLRAVARSRLAQGQSRAAIDLLLEARDGLPAGHDPAWIDAELRRAYAVLGREQR